MILKIQLKINSLSLEFGSLEFGGNVAQTQSKQLFSSVGKIIRPENNFLKEYIQILPTYHFTVFFSTFFNVFPLLNDIPHTFSLHSEALWCKKISKCVTFLVDSRSLKIFWSLEFGD